MMVNDLFKGKLIRLIAVRNSDAEEMASWQEHSDYLRKVDTDFALPKSIEALRERDQSKGSGNIEFRLRTLEEDKLIGFVALHGMEWNNQACLLAIGIGNPEYRGKGYGTEALNLILRYAFYELNLNRVGLDVISYNLPAIKAYEKAGFMVEGQMRSAVLRDGKQYDRVIMGILREEWMEKQG